MEHLDFTIDFETCSLSANAAVMQVAVLPWLRENKYDPFCNDLQPFVGFVDLRTCVMDGYDFDMKTVLWWSRQNPVVKRQVLDGTPKHIAEVTWDTFNYIRDTTLRYNLQSLCLWCQGPDVDIAILRNLCRRYVVDLEEAVPHTGFRDCRTVILEAALMEARRGLEGEGTNGITPEQVLATPSLAYKFFAPLPEEYSNGSDAHDALYDAYKSSWNTWQALGWMNREPREL